MTGNTFDPDNDIPDLGGKVNISELIRISIPY